MSKQRRTESMQCVDGVVSVKVTRKPDFRILALEWFDEVLNKGAKKEREYFPRRFIHDYMDGKVEFEYKRSAVLNRFNRIYVLGYNYYAVKLAKFVKSRGIRSVEDEIAFHRNPRAYDVSSCSRDSLFVLLYVFLGRVRYAPCETSVTQLEALLEKTAVRYGNHLYVWMCMGVPFAEKLLVETQTIVYRCFSRMDDPLARRVVTVLKVFLNPFHWLIPLNMLITLLYQEYERLDYHQDFLGDKQAVLDKYCEGRTYTAPTLLFNNPRDVSIELFETYELPTPLSTIP